MSISLNNYRAGGGGGGLKSHSGRVAMLLYSLCLCSCKLHCTLDHQFSLVMLDPIISPWVGRQVVFISQREISCFLDVCGEQR